MRISGCVVAATFASLGLACSDGATSAAAPPPTTTSAAPPATRTEAPPSSVAHASTPSTPLDPFVTDVWLLRSDPDDDDETGRAVVVLSSHDASNPRPDGLVSMGSAISHDARTTFFRVADVTPLPIDAVTILGDVPCRAQVTRASTARIASQDDDGQQTETEALVLDVERCSDGLFAAGPGAATFRSLRIDDASMFSPAPRAVAAAVGRALHAPLLAHALDVPGAFVVGNRDRLCVVQDDVASCDTLDVPYAEVHVDGRTFLLFHGENDDYASAVVADLGPPGTLTPEAQRILEQVPEL